MLMPGLASYARLQTGVLPIRALYAVPSLRCHKRCFTSSPRRRKDDIGEQTTQRVLHDGRTPQQGVKPENVTAQPSSQAVAATSKPDPLLGEQKVTNKEQRTADWAIIKDMVQYLWPKNDFNTKFRVGLSVALLIGAKVRNSLSFI